MYGILKKILHTGCLTLPLHQFFIPSVSAIETSIPTKIKPTELTQNSETLEKYRSLLTKPTTETIISFFTSFKSTIESIDKIIQDEYEISSIPQSFIDYAQANFLRQADTIAQHWGFTTGFIAMPKKIAASFKKLYIIVDIILSLEVSERTKPETASIEGISPEVEEIINVYILNQNLSYRGCHISDIIKSTERTKFTKKLAERKAKKK